MHLTTAEAAKVCMKMEVELVECKHHVRGFLVVEGRRIFPVHYSNGRKDLPGDIPHRFRKALYLSVEEFQAFLTCTLSRREYIAILAQRGVLD
jgi:hypothetical protein